jgi:hypothetical protein
MRSGSRLQLITYELADGSRDVDREVFYDAKRGEDCRVMLLASGTRHCIPTTAGGTTIFSENTCRQAFGAAASSEPPGYFVRSFKLDGLALPSRLYRPGVAIEAPAQRWEQQDSFCLGPYPVEPLFYFRLGEEIAGDSFVTVRTERVLEDERLTLAIDGTDDDWRMPGVMTDRAVAQPCTLQPGANASDVGCVPALPTSTYYADAECTAPLVTAARTVQHVTASNCSSIVSRGAMIGGQVFEQLGESCVAVPEPPDTLYAAGDSLPIATLAREERPATGDRLVPVELTRAALHERDPYFHDRELDADCRVTLVDGRYLCAPFAPVAPVIYFSDDACKTPQLFAFVPTGACAVPARFAADATGFYRVGPVYPAPIYELTTGDRCAAYVPPARFSVHSVTPVSTDAFVPATRRRN